jgi:mannosyl-glycoprotein endo-beta-N-acetylglucosaminidase
MLLCLSLCTTALAYTALRRGSSGSAVKTLQHALKSKGYFTGTIDGEYGQKTQSAVYRYQKAIGLHANGKAGNTTLTALYDGTSAANSISSSKAKTIVTKNSSTLHYGSTGTKVQGLQRLLKAAGYFKGSIDGKFGSLTLRAVKRYQWAHGLHGDGLAGTVTMKSLKEAVSD